MASEEFRVAITDPDGQIFEVAEGQWVKAKAVDAPTGVKAHAVPDQLAAFDGNVTVELPAEPGTYHVHVRSAAGSGGPPVRNVRFVVVKPLAADPNAEVGEGAKFWVAERTIRADERL